jgi:hypothetical protein
MPQSDDLEARVAALETRVRELSEEVRHSAQDAAAARVLAGGADRDVTEVREEMRDFRRATTASFNALRQDMTDMRDEMRAGFATGAARQQQIVDLLNTLITGQGDDRTDQ